MRLAIISLHLHSNIGGILQSYALQTALERMGNEVTIVDSVESPGRLPKWKLCLLFTKWAIKRLLRRPAFPPTWSAELRAKYPFISRYLHLTGSRDFSALSRKDFDGFVVGSDQVWRQRFFSGGRPRPATEIYEFLSFAKEWRGIRRVAYAASFGEAEWNYPDNETAPCAELAKMFDAVSVREDSAAMLCREYLGVEAKHVIDPTMLLKKEDYCRLIEAAGQLRPCNDIFCYVLDSNADKWRLTRSAAKLLNMKLTTIAGVTSFFHTFPGEIRFAKVEEWLRCFRDAKCVVTDSFHGCVFSIIFDKPFVVISNAGRGSTRMESLTRMFGLNDRLIDDPAKAKPEPVAALLSKPADVSARLESLRAEAYAFLRSALS